MQGTAPDPPFWIRETDDLGRPLDPGVLASAQRIWKRILNMAEARLHDRTCALEILEAAALRVSARLSQVDGEPIRDIDSYLFLACVRRIDKLAAILNREQSGNGPGRLEIVMASTSDGWEGRFFSELLFRELLSHMDVRTRRIFGYRSLEWSWRDIAAELGYADFHSAETQYGKGLKAARERIANCEPPEPEAE